MCPITINKALLLQEGILKFELSWTAVIFSLALLIFDSLILLIKTLIGIVRSCFVGFLTRLNIYLLIYDLVEKI